MHNRCDSSHPGQTCLEAELEDALSEASPEEVLEIFKTIELWTVDYCKICGEWNNPYRSHKEHCKHCGCKES